MPDHEGRDVAIPDVNRPEDEQPESGWGARLAAGLDLQLGKITDGLDATTSEIRKLRQEARRQPALVKISSVFTYSSTGIITQQGGTGVGVLIGGPEVGQEWNVRQIVVTGTTLTAAPAGVAWFLVSAGVPNELSPTSVMDFSHAALPQVSFYSPDQFYLAPNENLYMVITGGTANTQYVCSVLYQNVPFVPRSTLQEV